MEPATILLKQKTHTLTVAGGGSWGTAIAAWLAGNGHRTRLWARSASVVDEINSSHRNSAYLPQFELPPQLSAHTSIVEALQESSAVVVVVPSHAFREILALISAQLGQMDVTQKPVVIWGTKGFVPHTGQLLGEIANKILGDSAVTAVLSGPSFAAEIVTGLPAALVVATNNTERADSIADWFRNDVVRIYTNPDMTGVQLGGAVKNVLAIAAGISDGLGFGVNARTALITRGLAEMRRLGKIMGASETTLTGLAGMGDLILTCSADLSRNRRVGLGLGQGKSLEAVLQEIGQEAEGVHAARDLHQLRVKLDVAMPISTQVYRILFKGLSASDAVRELLLRDAGTE